MRIEFSETAWSQYLHWQKTDRAVTAKINVLLKDCVRSPFAGIGKPERLRNEFSGFWSRRITDEHRLVYRVSGDVIQIAQCRYHYRK
jgi:toxin YoeB